jgi:Spy/CpxP family protein refolding chaperone
MKSVPIKIVASIVSLTAISIAAGSVFGPARAQVSDNQTIVASNDEPLVDKPFEECLLQHFEKKFFNRIEATGEQREKLSAILSERIGATRPLREKLRHEFLAMTDLMANDTATAKDISSQEKVVMALRDELADERLSTALKVREVLTPAQRQKISNRVHEFLNGDFKPGRLMGLGMPVNLVQGRLLSSQ